MPYPIEDAVITFILQIAGVIFVMWIILIISVFLGRSIRW